MLNKFHSPRALMRLLALLPVIAVVLAAACRAASVPLAASITAPTMNAEFTVGQPITISGKATGSGLKALDVYINGRKYATVAQPVRENEFETRVSWVSDLAGTTVLHITGVNDKGKAIIASEAIFITIKGATPTAAPAPPPEPTIAPTPTVAAMPRTAPLVPLVPVSMTVWPTGEYVNVRKGPGTNYDKLGQLNAGQSALVRGTSEDGKWLQINFAAAPDGVGWVIGELVTFSGDASKLEVVKVASPSSTPKIMFAFMREENIYLYQDGEKRLLISPVQGIQRTTCHQLYYSLLSPDRKYLAYIEQTGEPGEESLMCFGGLLKIFELETGTVLSTTYLITYFNWNPFNQLEFRANREQKSKSGQGIDPIESKVDFLIVDPESQKEVVSETISISDSYRITGFPLYSNKKSIRYQDGKYYLVDQASGKESFLLADADVRGFIDWSPDGKYALFDYKFVDGGNINRPFVTDGWIAVNTENLNEPRKEVIVYHPGGSGGMIPIELKWYFNEAFISRCSWYLSFLDGREPLDLSNDRPDSCQNVATSPDGNHAFLSMKDGFELHSSNGDRITIHESGQLPRNLPLRLIWLDNDNLVIFASAYGGSVGEPGIYLFERKFNSIRRIVQDGSFRIVI